MDGVCDPGPARATPPRSRQAPGRYCRSPKVLWQTARCPQVSDAFRRAAHSLKTNSITFGATRLGALAREVELGGLVTDAAPVDALEAEYQRVAAALQEIISG